MKLKEQKRFGILYATLGAALLLSGLVFSEGRLGDVCSTFGCCLFACGAARLVRVFRLGRNPEKAREYETSFTDERTAYLANKARALTFYICIYAQIAAGLIAIVFFRQTLIGQTLCLLTCAQSLIYSGCYWILNRKY